MFSARGQSGARRPRDDVHGDGTEPSTVLAVTWKRVSLHGVSEIRAGCPGQDKIEVQARDHTCVFCGAAFATGDRMAHDDRPRERLWRRGLTSIGDEELLAILLGSGVRSRPAGAIAAEVMRASGGVVAVSRASLHELCQTAGIGSARAARIAAAFELGRRALEMEQRRDIIGSPEDIFRVIGPRLIGVQQEMFFAIGIDIRNQLLDIVEVARGTVHGVEVHPREVFRPLVRMAAAGAILAHNHPSGDPTPSAEDERLTERLRDVGDLVGIPIIDHVVISEAGYRSVAEWSFGMQSGDGVCV